MSDKLKSFLPHVIAVVVFLILALVYSKPVFNNKVLYQYDVIQSQGASKEVLDYEKKTGKFSLWTNSMFGGMPSYTIVGRYPGSFTSYVAGFVTYLVPQPANVIFYLMVGFYIMMAVLGFSPWLSITGSIAFAFSSYNLISLEAGHISKVLAIAYAPPLIAGTLLLYQGRYIKGAIVTGVFMFFELYANHVQISYYLFIALLLLVIYQLVQAVREKRIQQFITASVIILVLGVLSVGSMASKFWTTYEYTKFTMRGGSELKSSSTEAKGGLDKDYAFGWSYGILETFTYLIPDFYGGASQGSLGNDSETYKVIKKIAGGEAARSFTERVPTYWGAQPNTGGPAYIGAIICFLFVLSFFVVRNTMKWWVLAVVVLFTMLAWGKNFYALTDLFFYYVPMYNKFRAVTMIHSLVAMFMSFMGMWGVKEIVTKEEVRNDLLKPLKITTIALGGFLLLLALLGGQFFSFEKMAEEQDGKAKSGDAYFVSNLEQMTQSKEVANEIYEAILQDRASLLKHDALRSLALILLAAALIWFYYKGKYKAILLYAGLSLLVLIDMWSVAKRYLNNDDFVPKRKYTAELEPSPADQQILSDPDPDYRVMNTTVSTFNDATTSYFHKSIGGYSAAKMRRFQDLIERHISEGNMNVLNMLNTKYIIQQGKDGTPVAARNPGALGHAWFVREIKWVNDADEEIAALKDFRPENIAVIDKKFKETVGNIHLDSGAANGSIELKEFAPDRLTYETQTATPGLVVFSEIYYNNSLGWESFIDGKPVPHFRTDYVLRGMVVPAGKHKIEFVFHPKSYYTGEKIALACSLLLFGGILGLTFLKVRKPREEEAEL